MLKLMESFRKVAVLKIDFFDFRSIILRLGLIAWWNFGVGLQKITFFVVAFNG